MKASEKEAAFESSAVGVIPPFPTLRPVDKDDDEPNDEEGVDGESEDEANGRVAAGCRRMSKTMRCLPGSIDSHLLEIFQYWEFGD